MRDECLNQHWFTDLDDARRTITDWTLEYNEEREHGTLGTMPREFARSAMESAEIANSAIPALPTAPARHRRKGHESPGRANIITGPKLGGPPTLRAKGSKSRSSESSPVDMSCSPPYLSEPTRNFRRQHKECFSPSARGAKERNGDGAFFHLVPLPFRWIPAFQDIQRLDRSRLVRFDGKGTFQQRDCLLPPA
jgi:Integrase core domain